MDKIDRLLSTITPVKLFQIDRRSLELYRIYACIWTFRDLLLRLQDFEAFHCVTGLFNNEDFTPHGLWFHRLLFYRGSIYYQCLLFSLHFIITLLFLIGFRIKVTSFLHFLFTISLHERNMYFTDGGDKLFRHLAFWAALLPTQHYLYYYNEKQFDSNLPMTNDNDSDCDIFSDPDYDNENENEAVDNIVDSQSNNKIKKSDSNVLRKRRNSSKRRISSKLKSRLNSKSFTMYDSNNRVVSHYHKTKKQHRVWRYEVCLLVALFFCSTKPEEKKSEISRNFLKFELFVENKVSSLVVNINFFYRFFLLKLELLNVNGNVNMNIKANIIVVTLQLEYYFKHLYSTQQ